MARIPHFGTDGIRGRAPEELTPELVRRLGAVAVQVLGGPRVAVGRDPRASGGPLQEALVAGMIDQGVDVIDLGVVPTPVVAHVGATEGVPGAMISASHNPAADNGVKLFAVGGRKLDDDLQALVQARLDAWSDGGGIDVGRAAGVGRRSGRRSGPGDRLARYRRSVVASIGGRDLSGLRLVVDCANGAASSLAPAVLHELGADVEVIFGDPDGHNINAGCGSTDPAALQHRVRRSRADAGLAFDGDADRVLAIDAQGGLVDGDQIIAVCALDRHRRGVLRGGAVVVTVMANLGFHRAMAEHGIAVVETPVGDRHVLEALEAHDLDLGGEQSGHVIFRDLATTGDGLLTAVQLLDVVGRTRLPLAELAAVMTRLPQVLRSVAVRAPGADLVQRLLPELEEVRSQLGDQGRVLVRPSGTEQVVRVMVEAPTAATAESLADHLVAELGRLDGEDPTAG